MEAYVVIVKGIEFVPLVVTLHIIFLIYEAYNQTLLCGKVMVVFFFQLPKFFHETHQYNVYAADIEFHNNIAQKPYKSK